MDGVDAALVRLTHDGIQLLAFAETPYPDELREALEDVVRRETLTLERFGSLNVQVGQSFAQAALALLSSSGISPAEVIAIGSHGQTLLHKPQANPAFSLQIGDPSCIAYATGIVTVADFRSKDIAAHGQGAPLVPAFHQFAWGGGDSGLAVLNIGGIANVTLFPESAPVLGFDTGPGNTLLDLWIRRHRHEPFDRDGSWGRSGTPDAELLMACLDDKYFRQAAPKSSGRDYFNLDWLRHRLPNATRPQLEPCDVQATLAHVTARSIAQAIAQHLPVCRRLAVCGGGAKNGFLMELLGALLPSASVQSTDALGLPASAVEACAFAWLAARRLGGESGNIPSVTGAQRALVLGGIYAPA